MSTSLRDRYNSEQLKHVPDQAGSHMCACPAQVATHRRIAGVAVRAHAVLEEALDDVLRIEGRDEQSLTMPEGLRALRDSQL